MVLFLPFLMGGAILGGACAASAKTTTCLPALNTPQTTAGFGASHLQGNSTCKKPPSEETAPDTPSKPLRVPTTRPLWATSQDNLDPEYLQKVRSRRRLF